MNNDNMTPDFDNLNDKFDQNPISRDDHTPEDRPHDDFANVNAFDKDFDMQKNSSARDDGRDYMNSYSQVSANYEPQETKLKQKSSFLATFESDLFKLKKQKSVWIGLIISFVMMFVVYCMFWILFVGADSIPEDELDAGISLGFAQLMSAMSLYGSASTGDISLFIMIITCIFVGGEFSHGTVRTMISRGANRTQSYFSKWLTLAILTIFYSIFALVVCGIFTSFKGIDGFGAEQFGVLMRCFFLQMLCNLSTMTIVLFLAYLCRTAGGALGASIGAYMAFSVVLSIISQVLNIQEANTDWVLFMPLQQMTIACTTGDLSAVEICAVVIMPFVYGGLCMLGSILTFNKRDIK